MFSVGSGTQANVRRELQETRGRRPWRGSRRTRSGRRRRPSSTKLPCQPAHCPSFLGLFHADGGGVNHGVRSLLADAEQRLVLMDNSNELHRLTAEHLGFPVAGSPTPRVFRGGEHVDDPGLDRDQNDGVPLFAGHADVPSVGGVLSACVQGARRSRRLGDGRWCCRCGDCRSRDRSGFRRRAVAAAFDTRTHDPACGPERITVR